MSETNKAVRLSKVAREFNVGIQTVVEFLSAQNIEVEANPNSKIEPNAYDMLVKEFQGSKKLKEKSQATHQHREHRETITLATSKAEEEKPVAEVALDLDALKAASKVTVEKAKKTAPVAKEDKPEEKAAEKAADSKVESTTDGDAGQSEVKVVGKIDLDKINQRTRPDKKSKAQVEEEKTKAAEASKFAKKAASITQKKEQKAAQAKEDSKVEAKAETPVEPVKETPKEVAPEAPKEPEIMKARAEKLTGVTLIGKIDLPVEHSRKKKEPVASSSDPNLKKKRKRKRIAKVDVSKQPADAKRGPAKKKTGGDKPEVTEADIQREIKETLAKLSGGGKSKASKLRRAKRDMVAMRAEEEMQRAEEGKSILKLTEFVTVSELATMMGQSATDIIGALMSLGIFASINQRLDAETISIIAEEYGFQVEFVSAEVQEAIIVEEDREEDLVSRPPIVTVMGHVDHGKTSLLDYVRKANVIAGEAGGITQHIGAYNVGLEDGRRITFLDTPGHEAFTAMRARGAQVTDLAIIVIAADDAVMPQTKEAINHAQAAGIPMIFALNKVDRPEANPDKIKEQLAAMNILVEDWGGKYQCQEISAKTGMNVAELLDKVLLEAEMLELKANPNKRAMGTVIESTLDKGRGYVTTILVESGTLRVGDALIAGHWSGRVKALHNERGQKVEFVGPAMPVSMLGLSGAPNAGDKFHVMEDEKEARSIAVKRQQLQREQGVRTQKHITIEEIGRRIAIGDFKELNLIIKGDVDGSIEALTDSLQKLSTEKIQVNIIHKGVGQISESDVLLASASDAIIVGFQVRPSANARRLAEKEEIQIQLYSVIYKAIEEIKDAMEGMLSAKIVDKITGTAEVRDIFKITKVGTIAGCFMLDGKMNRNSRIRVIREGVVIHTGSLGSLKRFKDDVKEVGKGYECGLNIDKFDDLEIGDQIESFEEVEVKQTL